jgi:hypothetical protein
LKMCLIHFVLPLILSLNFYPLHLILPVAAVNIIRGSFVLVSDVEFLFISSCVHVNSLNFNLWNVIANDVKVSTFSWFSYTGMGPTNSCL